MSWNWTVCWTYFDNDSRRVEPEITSSKRTSVRSQPLRAASSRCEGLNPYAMPCGSRVSPDASSRGVGVKWLELAGGGSGEPRVKREWVDLPSVGTRRVVHRRPLRSQVVWNRAWMVASTTIVSGWSSTPVAAGEAAKKCPRSIDTSEFTSGLAVDSNPGSATSTH